VRRSFVPTTYEPGDSSRWEDARARFSSLRGNGHEVGVGT
jgi:hypothetical protein